MMKIEFNEDNHSYTVDGKVVPSVTEIVGLLSKGKYEEINPSVLARAAHRGTVVHELCEQFDYGTLPEEIDPECEGYLRAYIAFEKCYQPEWVFSEKVLCNGEYAGTADRIGKIDGHLRVIDIKTTANMDRLSKLSLACQLVGYSNLLREQYDMDAFYDYCFGVQLKKDGTYTVIGFNEVCEKYDTDCADLFDSLLNITHIIRGEEHD